MQFLKWYKIDIVKTVKLYLMLIEDRRFMKKNKVTKTQYIKKKIVNTLDVARDVINTHYSDGDDRYRTEAWKKEISLLLKEKGKTEKDLIKYLYPEKTSGKSILISKRPKKRDVYIGIGLYLRQSEEKINEWIVRFSEKKTLYIKDCFADDLAWKYLIKASRESHEAGINYYKMHEEVKDIIIREYERLCHVRQDNIQGIQECKSSNGTAYLNQAFQNEIKKPDVKNFRDLKLYVASHFSSFESAYQKAREYLIIRAQKMARLMKAYNDNTVNIVLSKDARLIYGIPSDPEHPFNFFLNENIINISMRNYLCAESNIAAIDKMKHTRKAHIKMCLSLALTSVEIDEYLELMGFEPLSAVLDEEYILLYYLSKWEKSHDKVMYLRWKCGFIEDIDNSIKEKYRKGLDKIDMVKTVTDMAYMRILLKIMYQNDSISFPYKIHNVTKENAEEIDEFYR